MNREERLTMADDALARCDKLARQAETATGHAEGRYRVPELVSVAALWADIARSHAAIAQAMPETDDTTPEVRDGAHQ